MSGRSGTSVLVRARAAGARARARMRMGLSLMAAGWALGAAGCGAAIGARLGPPTAGTARLSAEAAPDLLDRTACTFDGHRLYGRIRVVDAGADVRVQVVTVFPDLRVQKVPAFADACGRWQMVDEAADTTVQLVTSFPDVRIAFVPAFPGIP